jgi:UDP-N-acetylglucosamine:LPS N-acetylglucosamine transferase
MAFPGFEAEGRKVLWFCRGRGRGHAITDLEIAAELGGLRKDLQIRFVSYGTGASTFAERDVPAIDLGLPDANSIAATTVLAGRVIGRLQPDVVVAHEEFSALPAAKIFGRPTVLITDYFAEAGLFSTESMRFADRVLFLERKGMFAEPAAVRGRVRYLGPAIRKFEYGRRQRGRAREELELDARATVITVFPGSWTEAMAPFAGGMLAAFDGLRARNKHLVWVAGQDAGRIGKLTGKRRDVTVVERDWQIDRLMAASDLAITKSTRTTGRELARMGIRTLAVNFGLNDVDARSVADLPGSRTIPVAKLNGRAIEKMLELPEPPPLRVRSRSCAVELAGILG